MKKILWRALCAEMLKPECPVPELMWGSPASGGIEFGAGERGLVLYFTKDGIRAQTYAETSVQRTITTPADLLALLEWVTAPVAVPEGES